MTPDEMDRFIGASRLLALYEQLERDITEEMARRIKETGEITETATYQAERKRQAQALQAEIKKKMQAIPVSDEVRNMVEYAAGERVNELNSTLSAANLDKIDISTSSEIQRVIETQLDLVGGTFTNITGTTAVNAKGQLYDILDRVALQVQSGAFTYDQAIQNGIKSLAKSGVTSVVYDSGVKSSLYNATRRALLTSVNQTAQKVVDAGLDLHGIDLVEVSAHIGARHVQGGGILDHAGWQGKVYSRSGKNSKYPPLVANTGYGSVGGLCGAYCTHSYDAFIEGASVRNYTDKQIEEMNDKMVIYQGQQITTEEALKKQRYMERAVRKWKAEEAAMRGAGYDTSAQSAKVKFWQKNLRNFTKETGLKRDYTRERG